VVLTTFLHIELIRKISWPAPFLPGQLVDCIPVLDGASPFIGGLDRWDSDAVLGTGANALIIGPDSQVGRVIEALNEAGGEPLTVWSGAAPLPPGRRRVLVPGIGELSAQDQRELFGWIRGCEPGTRIISTSRYPVRPLIDSGAFLEPLYYALNTLTLTLAR
jgi:hypothetical protein